MHLPQSLLLLLLALTPNILTLPDPRPPPHHQQQLLDPRSPQARQARQARLQAWNAQKPLHTTALLAGAAATAVPEARAGEEGRRRDGTGEKKGIWMPVLGWDDGDGKVGDDVRGERVLEGDFEGELMEELMEEEVEDEDGEVDGKDGSGSGVADVLVRVWRTVERIGIVVRRRRRVGSAKGLDDGHDGDL